MKRWMLSVLALVLSMQLTNSALAQGGVLRPPFRPVPGAARRRPMDQLGLTPAQRRQLNDMRRGRRAEQTRVSDEIRDRRRDLAEMYRFYPLDETRAALLIQRIAELEALKLRLQLQNQSDLRRILTREQFDRFNQSAAPRSTPPLVGRLTGP